MAGEPRKSIAELERMSDKELEAYHLRAAQAAREQLHEMARAVGKKPSKVPVDILQYRLEQEGKKQGGRTRRHRRRHTKRSKRSKRVY